MSTAPEYRIISWFDIDLEHWRIQLVSGDTIVEEHHAKTMVEVHELTRNLHNKYRLHRAR